ncbi:MAG: peptidylprolyl isomerase [Nitrospiria bacterium]
MTKRMRILFLLTLFLFFRGKADIFADSTELANVNDVSITTEIFEKRMSRLTQERMGPEGFDSLEVKKELLDGLISEELLNQEGRRLKLHQSKAVTEQINDLTRQLVVRETVNQIVKNKVTPEAMKQFYGKNQTAYREVHAQHILLKTEDEAKAIKKKLDEGADFSTLAKEASGDQGSAKNGGDLGFFMKVQMVKPFSDAAFSMKDNEISEPVKSNFGYHVIKVLESRTPTFDKLSAQQQQFLRSEMIQWEITQLKEKSKIVVHEARLKDVGKSHGHSEGESDSHGH